VIARAGRPVARLVPYVREAGRRPLGIWRGKVTVAPDFDETDEDLVALFER
jgi:antitoxin (DNA-binding transcriptional repressor) of toxin-antitoxin stability system